MATRQSIVPPNHHLSPLEGENSRLPLQNSNGNSQTQGFGPISAYNDSKDSSPLAERHMYQTPTLPSSSSLVPSWERQQRQQTQRRRRQQHHTRNPIWESRPYQAYRERQNRDGNSEDAKWPEQLEVAFLDALMFIPWMGRRKFSYRGKPHGRNELIQAYLWIAYLETLPPGAKPDPSMARSRKQVSSHIQVLKTFFKGHPTYDLLFSKPEPAKNSFDDSNSFKNDPCLRALSQGRLPYKSYDRYDEIEQKLHYLPMRPSMFWLLITNKSIDGGRSTSEQDLYDEGLVLHKYTGLTIQKQRSSIESILDWRHRFPQLSNTREPDSGVIHMDTSLDLMSSYPPDRAELVSRVEFSITGGAHLQNHIWQVTTSLKMPFELCKDPSENGKSSTSLSHAISTSSDEVSVKVPFPAEPWAYALVRLTEAQLRYAEERKYNPTARKSAREHLEQISMYQAIQSSSNHGRHFKTRAVFLWTFRKAAHGERSGTTWRYLNAAPPRVTIMSPGPHHSSQVSAIMNENFHAFEAGQQPSMLDPFSVSGPHSPYTSQSFDFAAPLGYEMTNEDLSFSSTVTADSQTTLLDTESSNIDHYLANSHARIGLDCSDPQAQHWPLPSNGSFEDSAWANYSVSGNTPQIGAWETSASDNTLHDPWHEILDGKQIFWGPSTPKKLPEWEASHTTKEDWECTTAQTPIKDGWAGSSAENNEWAPELKMDHSSTKPSEYDDVNPITDHEMANSIERCIEQKLRPWIETHSNPKEPLDAIVADPVVSHLEKIAALEEKPEKWVDAAQHHENENIAHNAEGLEKIDTAQAGKEVDLPRPVV